MSAVCAGSITAACSSPPAPPAAYSPDDGWQSKPAASARSPRPSAHRPQPIPVEDRKPWHRLATLETLAAVGTRGPSEHLAGAYERTVRINELAAPYRVAGSRVVMPPGALILQLHHPPGEEVMTTAYVMEKREPGFAPKQGDWEYLVLDSNWKVEARGPMPTCAACHLAAQRDSLFGPP